MWRAAGLAVIVYLCGYPALDGYRPAALDAPLRAFYDQVNRAGEDGRRMLGNANSARSSYIRSYMAGAEKQLSAVPWRRSMGQNPAPTE
ncbi:MAG TPA: hypothetical protein VIY51_25350 [Xanthobacteraceae bacterium]